MTYSPNITGTVTSNDPVTTYQGTLILSANTSTAVNTLTLSGGTSFPSGAIGNIFIFNSGSNIAYICWFGGTASASGGSFPLAAGAAISRNIGSSTIIPTVFSPAGTTLTITN